MKLRTWIPIALLGIVAACTEAGPTGPEPATLADPSIPAGPDLAGQSSPPAVAHFSLSPASGEVGGPTVTTDKEDYAPGDTVTITGSGWWAGETVELRLEEDPATHDPLVFSSVADESGAFVNRDFVVEEHDLGVTFALTATGLTSGLTAGATFTDAAPTVNSFTLNGVTFTFAGSPPAATNPITVAPSATVTIVVNATTNASGGPNPNATWKSTRVQFRGGAIDFGSAADACNDDDVVATSSVTTTNHTFTFSAPGSANTYDVRVRAYEGHACSGTSGVLTYNGPLIVSSPNQPPVAEAGGPYTGNEGAAIQLDGSGSTDPDGTISSYQWNIVSFSNLDGGTCSFVSGTSTGSTPSVRCDDNGTLTVRLTVTDNQGATDTDDATVTVANVAPDVSITAPAAWSVWPITGFAGVANFINAPFTDAGKNDTHTCAVDWGNGAGPFPGVVTETQGTGTGTCTMTPSGNPYLAVGAGIYTIVVTVTDDDGAVGSASVGIVVYDPSAGFVTGGGWINSPVGAYKWDTSLTGKANFGFVSKYKKGATRPDGNTEFQFQAGGLNFHSNNYDWLVVNQAGTNAQYKGTGTINGSGAFRFQLWAGDGSPDTFRIRIWEEDSYGVETVVYDNGPNPQALGGGSIVIHTGGKK